MASTHRIQIVNNSSDRTPYVLFCHVPDASSNIGRISTNIYTTTPDIPSHGGSASIMINESHYAVCGISYAALAPEVNVTADQSKAVELGPNGNGKVNVEIEHGEVVFNGQPEIVSNPGGFELVTGIWQNAQYPYAFCGYGKIQPNKTPSTIIPVATWAARSSQIYTVYPKVVYYISTGRFKPGDVVDLAMFGEIATVDFTGRKETRAHVVFNDDGTYRPTLYRFES